MSDRKFLGIITARSGSKGLKNKNLLKMNNYPLIYWPIKTFRNSKYINHFILSTDSKKIAKVSKNTIAWFHLLDQKYYLEINLVP